MSKMYDHVQLNGHELSYYNDQKIWCTGHSQTMINAYDFIHSDVPEIDPLGFKRKHSKYVADLISIR